jgi:hypothetical protein
VTKDKVEIKINKRTSEKSREFLTLEKESKLFLLVQKILI